MDELTDDQIIQSVNVNLTGAMFRCERDAPILQRQHCDLAVNGDGAGGFAAAGGDDSWQEGHGTSGPRRQVSSTGGTWRLAHVSAT